MLKGIWVTANLDKLGINKGSGRQLAAGLVVERWTGVKSILDIRFATTDKKEKGFIVGLRDHNKNAGYSMSDNTDVNNPLKTIIDLVNMMNKELKAINDVDGTKWDLWLTEDPSIKRFNLVPRVGRWIPSSDENTKDKFVWKDKEV